MSYTPEDFIYIDTHCHFFPPQIFKSIWNFFEVPDKEGNPRGWDIKYKLTTDALVKFLENQGVKYFTTYNYAHKSGIAEYINDWTYELIRKNKHALPFGCVWPEDANRVEYIQKLFDEYKFLGVKLQLLVQNFYPDDDRMHDIYKLVVDRGKWINFHVGTAPYHNQYVGYKNFTKFIEKYPNMNVIVAHLGTYETHKFFNLLDKYENLYLDTAMVYLPMTFSKHWKDNMELPSEEELLSHEDRILFGSDFPNIPYDYSCSIEGLLNLNLPKSFYDKIFYENAKRIFRIN